MKGENDTRAVVTDVDMSIPDLAFLLVRVAVAAIPALLILWLGFWVLRFAFAALVGDVKL